MTDVLPQQEPIRSTFPRPSRPPRLVAVHTRMVAGSVPRGSWTACRSPSPARSSGCWPATDALGMTSTEIGLDASVYLVCEIISALVFGMLSDQLGRSLISRCGLLGLVLAAAAECANLAARRSTL